MTKLLQLDHVIKKFGGLTAINDFSASLDRGELCALIGPNGSGKTTIFNVITGIYTPTSGKVFLNGEDISGVKPDLITGRGIARTFQNIRLFKGLDVLGNVMLAMHMHLRSNVADAVIRTPRYNLEEADMHKRGMELLEALGLVAFAHAEPTSLPYGKQRKLEIARALATQPHLLLLDEPAAGMSPSDAEELMEFITSVMKQFDLTIFLIEHQMRVVMGICPRIIVIDHGEIIAEGSPLEIQNNNRVIEAYLGVEAHA
jgi:branched-chain amino acid transport system ATP-binding protein